MSARYLRVIFLLLALGTSQSNADDSDSYLVQQFHKNDIIVVEGDVIGESRTCMIPILEEGREPYFRQLLYAKLHVIKILYSDLDLPQISSGLANIQNNTLPEGELYITWFDSKYEDVEVSDLKYFILRYSPITFCFYVDFLAQTNDTKKIESLIQSKVETR